MRRQLVGHIFGGLLPGAHSRFKIVAQSLERAIGFENGCQIFEAAVGLFLI